MNNLQAANDARIKKHLSSVIRYCNRTMCIDTWLIQLKSEGYTSEAKEVPKYGFNRRKFNRMYGHEQMEYQKKLEEKKIEYRAVKDGSILVLSKIEYDYFNSLTINQ